MTKAMLEKTLWFLRSFKELFTICMKVYREMFRFWDIHKSLQLFIVYFQGCTKNFKKFDICL